MKIMKSLFPDALRLCFVSILNLSQLEPILDELIFNRSSCLVASTQGVIRGEAFLHPVDVLGALLLQIYLRVMLVTAVVLGTFA